MYHLAISLSIISSWLAGSSAAPLSKLSRRNSPVLAGLNADPNIAVFGTTYYLYPTTDGNDWEGKDFYVWKSDDLVDWTRSEAPILSLNGESGVGNVPWSDGKAWAPTIIERGGKYYFYHSGNNPAEGTLTIGAAVADSPEGPFTGQPTAMIHNTEKLTASAAIDPAAFLDPVTGKYYLYWGNGRALYAELNDDMVSINEDTIGENTGLDDYFEAPFVVYRNGLYHMTWSIGDTRSEDYRVGYASAPSATGPWTSHGIILQKDTAQGILGTGHQSIINVPGTDDWYIAYHRFAIPGGDGMHRETTIDRVTFNADTGLIEGIAPTLSSVQQQKIA
ncbi:glycosyl hydrolase [Xylariales sp. AK1849]|nr:glycosyl hydrolase [Xylariales sp. AK1849]